MAGGEIGVVLVEPTVEGLTERVELHRVETYRPGALVGRRRLNVRPA